MILRGLKKAIFLWVFPFLLVAIVKNSGAQEEFRETLQYLSPRPGAEYVMQEQKISFRLWQELDPEHLSQVRFHVEGSVSGLMAGEVKLATDEQTVIFCPEDVFCLNETVYLLIDFPEDLKIPDFKSHFFITSLTSQQQAPILAAQQQMQGPPTLSGTNEGMSSFKKTTNDSLPEGFPEISITHWDNPSGGYIFVSPLDYDNIKYFEIILDNYATPVFYREVPHPGVHDFKLQPNGSLTGFACIMNTYLVYNSNFEIVDTISGQNGYTADLHELRLYENNHSFLLCYDPQLVDMSQVVEGGQEDAVVTGLIVQELDEDKNVVFQWRSWDHYQITDASNWIDLTANIIDYVHGNSIEVCSDSVLMISSRNMNEITKINRNTGEIIWRLNGENNMFEFIEPADSFCMQHSIRLMPDSNNISLFDNGNCWNPPYSSALELELDEENFTCTLVERLRSDPDIYGPWMGNTQRLHNGHTINGWGKGIPSVTEFDADGNIVLQFSFPLLNYRAFKFEWNHTVFTTSVEHIDFGTIPYQDSATASFQVINTYSEAITINRIVNYQEVYSVTTPLPVEIPPGESSEFEVKFKPGSSQAFEDVITLCWEIHSDTQNQRISRQVELSGSGTDNEGIFDLMNSGFKVYPNPNDGRINIKSSKRIINKVEIYTLDGRKIEGFEDLRKQDIQLSLDLLPGTYVIRIFAEDGQVYSGSIIRR